MTDRSKDLAAAEVLLTQAGKFIGEHCGPSEHRRVVLRILANAFYSGVLDGAATGAHAADAAQIFAEFVNEMGDA